MASDIVSANKNGDWKICKNSRKDKDKVNEYCNANFIDNYFKKKTRIVKLKISVIYAVKMNMEIYF